MIALTEIQWDRILDIFQSLVNHLGRFVDNIPAILTLAGTAFLIIRQFLNNKTVVGKLEETKAEVVDTKQVASTALATANNTNGKIADAMVISAQAAELASKVLVEKTPIDVLVTNTKDNPVPTEQQK